MGVNNLDKSGLQFYTEALWDKIKSRQGLGYYDGTPVGTVISYMGKIPPEGYLTCDGAVYNVALYPELVKHIRENFGSINFFGGDGTTTFGVPDLRGEFLRGAGTAARETGSGDNIGEHQNPTQQVNVLSGLDELRRPWIGDIVKIDGNSVAHVNRTLNYDKEINTSQSGVRTFCVDDPIDAVSDQNWLGINYKNEPVMYTSRPTNTSVLYCIKYQTTLEKLQRKYLINTDTLKLMVNMGTKMCHLYLNGHVVQNKVLFNIPKGYEPEFDVNGIGLFSWDSEISKYIYSIKILSDGNVVVKAISLDLKVIDVPIGHTLYGTIEWPYKQTEGG